MTQPKDDGRFVEEWFDGSVLELGIIRDPDFNRNHLTFFVEWFEPTRAQPGQSANAPRAGDPT